jgi:hypothetical protein
MTSVVLFRFKKTVGFVVTTKCLVTSFSNFRAPLTFADNWTVRFVV